MTGSRAQSVQSLRSRLQVFREGHSRVGCLVSWAVGFGRFMSLQDAEPALAFIIEVRGRRSGAVTLAEVASRVRA